MSIYSSLRILNTQKIDEAVGQPLLPWSAKPASTSIARMTIDGTAHFGLGDICKRAQSEAREIGADAVVCIVVEQGTKICNDSSSIGYELPVRGPLRCTFDAVRFTGER